MSENLTVNQLLKLIYRGLFKGKTERLRFPRKILVEVANDSDGHKERIGSMRYMYGKIVR